MGDYAQGPGGSPIDSFFARQGLLPAKNARSGCDGFLKEIFPGETIEPVPAQGYCSYTVIIGAEKIVQFRPADYEIDIEIAATACQIFGLFAPKTELLGVLEDTGLRVYSLEKLEGVSLANDRSSSVSHDLEHVKATRRQVIKDFAKVQADAWKHRLSEEQIEIKGTVGSSLQKRLTLMEARIPRRFRKFASTIQRYLPGIRELPWVLTHGDFTSSNVLVCPSTGHVVGLIDWAEAEWLPFGVGLYGLEELLGDEIDGIFTYFPEARELRSLFWRQLLFLVPEISEKPVILETMKQAQVQTVVGILLWHGIAFDDGRLDRAVEEGVDDAEIQRLDAFLLHKLGARSKRKVHERVSFSVRYIHDCLTGRHWF